MANMQHVAKVSGRCDKIHLLTESQVHHDLCLNPIIWYPKHSLLIPYLLRVVYQSWQFNDITFLVYVDWKPTHNKPSKKWQNKYLFHKNTKPHIIRSYNQRKNKQHISQIISLFIKYWIYVIFFVNIIYNFFFNLYNFHSYNIQFFEIMYLILY